MSNTIDIHTFSFHWYELDFVLVWDQTREEYYIRAMERGEWMEDFSDLPQEKLPAARNDDAAIRAVKLYTDMVYEELRGRDGEPQPDWELQARYDEAHGTVNGGDPAIADWHAAFPYGE